VLQINRTTYDQHGRPFEYLQSFFRGDKYVFYAEMQSEGAGQELESEGAIGPARG
jgi:hypothetical protein